ncbi:EpsG family protein [Chryseobacterium sp. MFBS3-17]|uniref:EpsG family protein n=1 Tax=Chryseobacterium sp. MFBS3-17 TaxID=2886689 RepID=UPI001D0DE8F1|nr:EpsG family protein [Chryseobacterium sp. MFBS3-17]MCC2591336.1 EpsG family protein [Chryseobacterium sp. MFBS3-17]
MVFLHPVFTVVFIVMILFSFMEINGNRKYSKLVMILLCIALIIFSGLRGFVGADYGVYRQMYNVYFPTMVEYSELYDKALFRQTAVEIEWLYAWINKFFLQLTGLPFHFFTLLVSVFVISLKFITFFKNSAAPVFALLFYFIPVYFIADSGHMRQALGMTVLLFSFKYIKERKVWMYLLCIYIAFGFHKSSIVFLPAYWFATVNLNARKIVALVLVSIALSPLQIYEYFGFFLDAVSVQEINEGFEGYIIYEIDETGVLKFPDVLSLFYAVMMIMYDKETCRKIPYYEYMRNIGVLGVCIYFVMRENPVFSTRLVGPYMLYMTLIMSNVFASISDGRRRSLMHASYIVFIIFYYFVFARYQAVQGRFTWDLYENFLW